MLLSNQPNLQRALKPFMVLLNVSGVIVWTAHTNEENGRRKGAVGRAVKYVLLAAVLAAVTVSATEEITNMIADMAVGHGLSTMKLLRLIYNLRWIAERLAQYSCILLAYNKMPHLHALVHQFSTGISQTDDAIRMTFPLQLPFYMVMVLFTFVPEFWIRVRGVLEDQENLAQNTTVSLATFATPGWMMPLRTGSPVVYHLLVAFPLRAIPKVIQINLMAVIGTMVYALTRTVEHCTGKGHSLNARFTKMGHAQRVQGIQQLRSQIDWISLVFDQYNQHCSLFMVVFCTCDILLYLGDVTWITDPSMMSSDMFCSTLTYELHGVVWDCLLILIHLRSTKAADSLERCMKELLIAYCNVLWANGNGKREDVQVVRLSDSPDAYALPVDNFCVQNWLDAGSVECPAASIGKLGRMRVSYVFSVLLSSAGFVIFLYELQKV